MSEEKTINEVYRDRNLLALALATMRHRNQLTICREINGPAAGWREPDADDADAGEWAIVWARLEGDQVSWHVPRELAESSSLPNYSERYDGHTRTEKNDRLLAYIGG